jgi:hypothetical protein
MDDQQRQTMRRAARAMADAADRMRAIRDTGEWAGPAINEAIEQAEMAASDAASAAGEQPPASTPRKAPRTRGAQARAIRAITGRMAEIADAIEEHGPGACADDGTQTEEQEMAAAAYEGASNAAAAAAEAIGE